MKVEGNRIFLKLLSPEDITPAYVDWMQDEEVVRFLESRWKTYTLEGLKEYVRLMNDGVNNFLFGIFLKENNRHIGNIKIGNISHIHRHADVGILIGEKDEQGKGHGTEAIELAARYAFEELNLNKLFAGMYADNKSSYNAFLKAGYKEAGVLKNHRFYKGRYVDEILVERYKD